MQLVQYQDIESVPIERKGEVCDGLVGGGRELNGTLSSPTCT